MKYSTTNALARFHAMSFFSFMLFFTATETLWAGSFAPPLRLVSFNAKNVDDAIVLEWRTVGENNTDYFTVEQGSDAVTFNRVGAMKAAGVDPLNRYYSFTDIRPATGNNYYRLAMYDLDGSVTYSATQVIKTGSIKRLSVLPNPVRNSSEFTIYWNSVASGAASVSVFELNGRQVYKGKLDPSGKTIVKVSNWPTGVYYITLDNGMRKEFSKLLVGN